MSTLKLKPEQYLDVPEGFQRSPDAVRFDKDRHYTLHVLHLSRNVTNQRQPMSLLCFHYGMIVCQLSEDQESLAR